MFPLVTVTTALLVPTGVGPRPYPTLPARPASTPTNVQTAIAAIAGWRPFRCT